MSVNIVYNNVNNILYWQGIRKLSDNYFLMVGTTNKNKGILNIGPVIEYNPKNSYLVMYPESNLTSVYGPDYYLIGIYRLVGIYRKNNDERVYGFLFKGGLEDLKNSENYITLNAGGNFTYLHSIMGDILVGNYDDIYKYGLYDLPFGPVSAFLYIISTNKQIEINYPGSTSNTAYGIWYNGGSSYTICGGYSTDAIQITDVYTETGPKPIGNAYIVNYDIETNLFSNWTSINYPYNKNLVTHFQGISNSSLNSYQLCADSVKFGDISNIGSWVNVLVDISGNFSVDKWIDIKYPLPLTITSANSVSENLVVGTYFNKDNEPEAFQSKIG
jgi:hypothetical protein